MNQLALPDPYEVLRPLMNRYGATGSAQQFHWAVRQAYHTAEAHRLDVSHEALFLALEPVWRALFAHVAGHPTRKLRVLDVGASTGLVGTFAEMHLRDRIASLTMMDPCAAMLEKCRRRAELFSFPCEFRQGDIDQLAEEERFDVITINGVLHHIVELPAFFERVRTLLAPWGWFLTAHDPRAEALTDVELQCRRQAWQTARENVCFTFCRRLGELLRRMAGFPYLSPMAWETSSLLLEQQAIRRPMPMASIFSVTDFHLPYRPRTAGQGISLRQMEEWLAGLSLVTDCTYRHFGVPREQLTRAEQQQEERWWLAGDRHGELFASAWHRDGWV